MLAEVEEPRRISPVGARRDERQSCGRSALAERRGSAGMSQQAHWLRQVKAGAWARGQAVAAARRATPTHGRHAASKLCRGRDARRGASAGRRAEAGQARRGAGLGWAERGEARAGGWLGRLRSWARSEATAREGGKSLFHLYFQGIFKCHLSNIILSKKMTSFENVPKIKVA